MRLDEAELELEFTDFDRDLCDDDTEPFSTFSIDSTDDEDEFDADEAGRDSSLSMSLMSEMCSKHLFRFWLNVRAVVIILVLVLKNACEKRHD